MSCLPSSITFLTPGLRWNTFKNLSTTHTPSTLPFLSPIEHKNCGAIDHPMHNLVLYSLLCAPRFPIVSCHGTPHTFFSPPSMSQYKGYSTPFRRHRVIWL